MVTTSEDYFVIGELYYNVGHRPYGDRRVRHIQGWIYEGAVDCACGPDVAVRRFHEFAPIVASGDTFVTCHDIDHLRFQSARDARRYMKRWSEVVAWIFCDDDVGEKIGDSTEYESSRRKFAHHAELSCQDTAWDDYQQIIQAGNAEVLTIHTELYKGALADLCRLQSLKALYLLNPSFGNDEVSEIGQLINLEILGIRSPNVTDASVNVINQLKQLRTLEFINCGVTDIGISNLADRMNLRALRIVQSPVSARGVATIATHCNLKVLVMRGIAVDDAHIDLIDWQTQLREVEIIDVSETQTTDGWIEMFACLPALQRLNLSWTSVTDNGLRVLQNCATLRELILSGTPASIPTLCELRWRLPRCILRVR